MQCMHALQAAHAIVHAGAPCSACRQFHAAHAIVHAGAPCGTRHRACRHSMQRMHALKAAHAIMHAGTPCGTLNRACMHPMQRMHAFHVAYTAMRACTPCMVLHRANALSTVCTPCSACTHSFGNVAVRFALAIAHVHAYGHASTHTSSLDAQLLNKIGADSQEGACESVHKACRSRHCARCIRYVSLQGCAGRRRCCRHVCLHARSAQNHVSPRILLVHTRRCHT
eukprot:365173-Chlamydomonas_euryale.AAC.7